MFDWFQKALDHDQRDEFDESLDLLFINVDEMCHRGEFKQIDEWIKTLSCKDYSETLIVGILVITRPAAHELPSRSRFFHLCFDELELRGRNAKDLIGNLKDDSRRRFLCH